MEKIFFLSLLLIIPLITSCKKYEHCDNATICVKNTGATPIPYAWNTNGLADTLWPGQSTSKTVGEYNADPNDYSAEMTYFVTDQATWAIRPTSCFTQKEIQF